MKFVATDTCNSTTEGLGTRRRYLDNLYSLSFEILTPNRRSTGHSLSLMSSNSCRPGTGSNGRIIDQNDLRTTNEITLTTTDDKELIQAGPCILHDINSRPPAFVIITNQNGSHGDQRMCQVRSKQFAVQ